MVAGGEADGNNLCAGNHDVLGRQVREAEDTMHHPLFILLQHAFLLAHIDEILDFILGEGHGLLVRLDTQGP